MSQRVSERLYTAQEFERMPASNESYELIGGRIVQKPVPKVQHNLIIRRILRAYDKFDPAEQLGLMLQETNVEIGPEDTYTPDISYWVASRRPKNGVLTAPYPDLAIEVQSPGQALNGLTKKAKAYQQAGVQLVWIIQPNKKIAAVFRQGYNTPVMIQPGGELDAGEVIPGFKLKLDQLFS